MITAGTNMKKILLTLTCALLLTGCLAQEPVEQQDNKPSETETQNDGQNTNENQQNSEDGSENSGQNEQTDDTGEDITPEQGDSTQEIRTKSVTFLNGGFTNSTLDQADSQQKFINWFNGSDDLLESINYSGYSQLNWIGNEKDSWRFSTLILGKSSENGNIGFVFSHKIKSIKINIQGYCKYIEYTASYSVDTNSKFYIDDSLTDLSVSAGFTGELEKKDVVKEYTTPTKSFTIRNKDGRVFVHSMELTYIHE